MGWIGTLLTFVRTTRGGSKLSDATVDRGGGDNVTADYFSAPGDDAVPLAKDKAAGMSQTGTGRTSLVGWIDPKNEQKANAGDKRIYARDATTGAQVIEAWLKNDGSGTMANANGSYTLNADGTIDINGDATIATKFGCNGKTAQESALVGATPTDLSSAITAITALQLALVNNGIGKQP